MRLAFIFAAAAVAASSASAVLPLPAWEAPEISHAANITGLTFTDVSVTIDGLSIRTYAGGDHLFIYAEDLASYGFDVTWLAEEDLLLIARAPGKAVSAAYPAQPIPPGRTTEDLINWYTPPIRWSTIVTCFTDGSVRMPVACYNHSGRMLIRLDDLAAYFGESYEKSDAAASLTLADGLTKPLRPMHYEAKPDRYDGFECSVVFSVDPDVEKQLYEALLARVCKEETLPSGNDRIPCIQSAAEVITVTVTSPLRDVDERTVHTILFAGEEKGTFRAVLLDYARTTVMPTVSVSFITPPQSGV